MSDSTENTADAGEQVQAAAQEAVQDPQGDTGFKAPSSQEELDRIIQNRVARVESKFQDYDEIKARAEKAAEFEATNADLLSRVQGFEAKEARSELVRSVAGSVGVDADLLAEMRGDSEEDLTAQAKCLASRLRSASPVIPGQAKSPEKPPVDERREFASKIFNS